MALDEVSKVTANHRWNRMCVRRHSAALLFLGAGVLIGCSDQAPGANEVIAVARTDGGIELQNSSDGPIVYAVLERRYFETALALWGPCPDLMACRLDPGERAVIPYSDIAGYTPSATEAVVAWWRIVPDGTGGEQVEDPQTVFVVLEPGASAVDASVEFVDIEGGCWVLKTDSVTYQPLGLPDDFRTSGRSVRAVIAPAGDAATYCMLGPVVRVLSIAGR
jgi:hypothetical protein